MTKIYEFQIWQDGIVVAEGSGSELESIKREMVHYATQYVQDGPIKITGSPELAPDVNREGTHMIQIDEIAYLDQLYEKATELDDREARDKFLYIVWQLWPEITKTFDEHKHSL